MNSMERYGSLAARAALATIFVISGLGKLAGPEGAAAYIASKGLPAPMLLALLARESDFAALTGGSVRMKVTGDHVDSLHSRGGHCSDHSYPVAPQRRPRRSRGRGRSSVQSSALRDVGGRDAW